MAVSRHNNHVALHHFLAHTSNPLFPFLLSLSTFLPPRQAPPSDVLQQAVALLRDKGNEAFRRKRFLEAIGKKRKRKSDEIKAGSEGRRGQTRTATRSRPM